MVTVVCEHCGWARDPGTRPGWCEVCAPDPEATARAAADVAHAHRTAVAAAQDPDLSLRAARRQTHPRPRPEPTVDPLPVGLSWRRAGGRAPAHLFARGEAGSRCDRVRDDGRMTPAPHGWRGCRMCAFEAGMTVWMTTEVTVE